MPAFSNLYLFFIASIALLLLPGPAVMYIIARSVHQGRTAGLVSVWGLQLGTLIQVLAASLGLSALIASSEVAFSVVKFAGAGYLIYIGVRTLFAKEKPLEKKSIEDVKLRQVFSQGVLVNTLNPKTTLFFIAFLPQFVNHGNSSGSTGLQIAMLGLLYVLLGTCTDSLYALIAGTVGSWIKQSRGFAKGQRIFAGTMYIGLGIAAALVGTESRS